MCVCIQEVLQYTAIRFPLYKSRRIATLCVISSLNSINELLELWPCSLWYCHTTSCLLIYVHITSVFIIASGLFYCWLFCLFFFLPVWSIALFSPFFAKEFLGVVEFYFLFQENKLFLQFGLWPFTWMQNTQRYKAGHPGTQSPFFSGPVPHRQSTESFPTPSR